MDLRLKVRWDIQNLDIKFLNRKQQNKTKQKTSATASNYDDHRDGADLLRLVSP